ncbi:ATPase family associated with various cellular activities (AAA) [Planctomycetes bacterium K23_9]|uniref:ATPase family associated with various cellular activities (AAA) n=2 Tax=Stieleria marina TaxID=1930275 RepID=A0A517NSM0_9BACT|nr:ATPase family associated with various cellular activities (AAA) [Planctomycetes bacterium K23_9]
MPSLLAALTQMIFACGPREFRTGVNKVFTRDNSSSDNENSDRTPPHDSGADAFRSPPLSGQQSPNSNAMPETRPSENASRTELMKGIELVRSELQRVIRGKADVIDQVLTAVLAEGSVLLEDVPGVGKTTLAKSLASLFDLQFQRVQCTPDLLPADILGSSIFQPATGEFQFRPGPIFCDLLIADEINRASPRTQSALLEAMAEAQVTIDGTRYPLTLPFIVIATQNPTGFEGTFPLPESQLDRFLFRMSMKYPDVESEIALLIDQASAEPSDSLKPVMSRNDLVLLQQQVRDISFDRKVAEYLVSLVGATRRDSRLRVGCSPRGSKMLLRAAQARAVLQKRDYVLPDDIQAVAVDVLSHRVASRNLSATSEESAQIVRELVNQMEVPV